jgi:HEAT repeat protein
MEVSVANLLLLGFLRYHPRVLDAWVSSRIVRVRAQLRQKRIIREHSIHVSIPIEFNGEMQDALTPKHLRAVFARKSARLLILGEGGAGKTSIACQILQWATDEDPDSRLAAWRILPVIIEQDLNLEVTKDKTSLTEVIRGQLKEMLELSEAPAEEMVQHLLQRKRILVVIDGLSELSDDTRNRIRPINPEFRANALVVTSRLEEPLDGLYRDVLRPLRIKGGRLSSFLEAYLQKCGKRGLFDDAEFFEVCRRLSVLVADQDATVLLAKLYADQTVLIKENGGTLPETIPDLMLRYLNEINRDQRGFSDATVQAAAKRIAWMSLCATLRPQRARVEDVAVALGRDKYEAQIEYMERKLKIVQVMGADRASLRLTLDPLAEYLGALHLIEELRNDEDGWNNFLGRADCAPGAPEAIKGFLLALRDCCLAVSRQRIPSFLISEIERRLGLDPAVVERAHRKQREAELIARLGSPFPDERAAAATALAKSGATPGPAALALASALKDMDAEVRAAAAKARWSLSGITGPLVREGIRALKNAKDTVRWDAVTALASMGQQAKPALLALLAAFLNSSNDESLRNHALRAANAIAQAGAIFNFESNVKNSLLHPTDETIQMAVLRQLQKALSSSPDAIEALFDALEDESVRWFAFQILVEYDPEVLMGVPLDMREKYLGLYPQLHNILRQDPSPLP